MEDDQAPQSATPEDERAAAESRVLALRQTIASLIQREEALQTRQMRIQSLMTRLAMQADQAQAGGHADLASQALEQRQRLQSEFERIERDMEEVAAKKKALAQEQVQWLSRIEALRSPGERLAPRPIQPSSAQLAGLDKQALLPLPWRPTKRMLWLGGLALLALLLPLRQTYTIGLTAKHPTVPTTVPAIPTVAVAPTPSGPFFSPNGTGPTNTECGNIGYRCYSPEDVQQAFNITSLYRDGYDGSGQTIVILGAGQTASLQSDLDLFDQAWGLPNVQVQILQPHGPPAPYQCAGGYDGLQVENTLDVEWSHAIAPGANIILIIGDNGGGSLEENCGNGSIPEDVTYALDQHLGQVISISYSGSELGDISESAAEHAADQRYYLREHSVFERAASEHVTVIAAAGDDGATNSNDFTQDNSYWNSPNVGWPASDPDVLAVGGTVLAPGGTANDFTYGNEVAWNYPGNAATGGGLSAVFSEPDYQKTVPDQSIFQGKRGVPDVAFPASDFVLYNSAEIGFLGQKNSQYWNHWDIIGGTSLSTPCWAGLIAIADQMRGEPLGMIQPILYNLQGDGMHDIISGDNSFAGVQGYQAGLGYDLVTGWGTPIADLFLFALIQAADHTQASCPDPHRPCQ